MSYQTRAEFRAMLAAKLAGNPAAAATIRAAWQPIIDAEQDAQLPPEPDPELVAEAIAEERRKRIERRLFVGPA